MNKKLLALSIFTVLVISSFGVASVMASENTNDNSIASHIQNIQKKFGITLTDEQKTQIEAKKQELETNKAEELTKWQSMTLEQWKQQEIAKINAVTQEEFDKIKAQRIKMLENNGWHKGGRFGFIMEDKPAE
jgi:alpha-galactosidase/6-phospho-beta-glucosidase family protein